MNYPPLTILICTYDRPNEIRHTITSLYKNLRYPNRIWHIADDGTSGNYVGDIIDWMKGSFPAGKTMRVNYTITNRRGWGANVNKALKALSTQFVFFTEDDYVLMRPLEMKAHVALMKRDPNIGMVRYGIVGHSFSAILKEADIKEAFPEFVQGDPNCTGSIHPGKINYWELDMLDRENRPFNGYKYSNRPHLKKIKFHDVYGYHPVGKSLAQTEHGMNAMITNYIDNNDSFPSIVCPADWVTWHFDHIGHSRQRTKDDLYHAS